MARPPKEIDEETVRKLAERQWDYEQIAAFFGVSGDTIKRRFEDVVYEAKHSGKAKLIDILWQRAVTEKSDKVLVHLADRILGPVPKKIELTREQAVEFLENDLRARGIEVDKITPTLPPDSSKV